MKILAFILALMLVSCAPLRPLAPVDFRKSAATQAALVSKNVTGEDSWDDVLLPWIGTPYKAGGNSKRGADCSGFTSSVYMEKERVSLPRTTSEQAKMGTAVDRNSLVVGDIVYFGENGKVNHVGIYTGKDNFIHASTSSGVMISPLDDAYWKPRYMGARRL
jgi:cell wall-associated NlpC family hydrolase